MKWILILFISLLSCSLNESVNSFFFNKNKKTENAPIKSEKEKKVKVCPNTPIEQIGKEKSNEIETYKKSIVLVKSKVEVPFVSDTEEVIIIFNNY